MKVEARFLCFVCVFTSSTNSSTSNQLLTHPKASGEPFLRVTVGIADLHDATDYCTSLPLPCPDGSYSILAVVFAGEEMRFIILGAISVR